MVAINPADRATPLNLLKKCDFLSNGQKLKKELDDLPYRNYGFVPLENNLGQGGVNLEEVFQSEDVQNVQDLSGIKISENLKTSENGVNFKFEMEEDNFADIEDMGSLNSCDHEEEQDESFSSKNKKSKNSKKF